MNGRERNDHEGTIKRRLENLEATLARSVETAKDTLLDAIRASIRGLVRIVGKESATQAERYLDELGPEEFTKQTIKGVLQGHGYERRPNESLAETMARAMGITSSELKARLQRGEGFNLPAPEAPERPAESVDSPRVLPKPASSGIWDGSAESGKSVVGAGGRSQK